MSNNNNGISIFSRGKMSFVGGGGTFPLDSPNYAHDRHWHNNLEHFNRRVLAA